MKLLTIILTVLMLGVLVAPAQQLAPPTASPPLANAVASLINGPAITGKIDMRFLTRTGSGPRDKYSLNVNVANSALFRGGVEYKPFVTGRFSDTPGSLEYMMNLDILNPRNPTPETAVNVGTLAGTVPVDVKNVYHFADGSAKIVVLPRGQAKGFESKFKGFAFGKPPATTGLSKLSQDTMKLFRNVGGKTVALTISKYDKMSFDNHVLAQGPSQNYPEVTVNGEMLYDYARNAWFLKGLTASYVINGVQMKDTLTGTIKWIEKPDRKQTGLGFYEFDIRFNEPPASEAAVFAAAQDESAFFDTDTSVTSLTGKVTYKDSFNGDTVTSSSADIDLVGNKLTKQQAMYCSKFIFLSTIVPFNSE